MLKDENIYTYLMKNGRHKECNQNGNYLYEWVTVKKDYSKPNMRLQ